MSYLGKVYKHEKDEEFDGFIKSLPVPEAMIEAMINSKPSLKLDKDGDKYTLSIIHPDTSNEMVFESGVEFEEKIMDVITFVTTITVEDNIVTQVQKIDDVILTFVKEYNDNGLLETITSSLWDGSARRYFTAE